MCFCTLQKGGIHFFERMYQVCFWNYNSDIIFPTGHAERNPITDVCNKVSTFIVLAGLHPAQCSPHKNNQYESRIVTTKLKWIQISCRIMALKSNVVA